MATDFRHALTTMVLALLMGTMGPSLCAQTPVADYESVPQPKEVHFLNEDDFLLSPSTPILPGDDSEGTLRNARLLSLKMRELTGLTLDSIATSPYARGILLRTNASLAPESYTMEVHPEGVTITGGDDAGVFYGLMRLIKSVPASADAGPVYLPAVTLRDAPRFAYRGAHLDVARHFFPLDSVKRYVDILALHQINCFHLHLTDDQGWRIQIKKYPRLTEVGSVRKETVVGWDSDRYDATPYGGFYTQDELRELVAYARDRYITIIPEIDLPGHQLAALAAYPELGCTGGPYEVWTHWGISDDVICAGNEQALRFLQDVLEEVMDVFPSEYIHIGGDECPKVRWEQCPKCQARISELGLQGDTLHSAETYLQSYVTRRMEEFVESRERHIIGWDEILEGKLAPHATVMSWRGTGGGIEAARQHHRVIMTPNTYLYFDYYQTRDTEHEPLAIGGFLPLERVYSFEPTEGIPAEYQSFITGVQANVWTEYIASMAYVEYMALPRLAALAEVQWCAPGQKDYPAFLQRLARLTKLYDRAGYRYRPISPQE